MKDECRDITAFLDEYLEARLAPETLRVFEEHIAECPDCERYLASYRATRALAQQALGVAPEPGASRAAGAAAIDPGMVPDRLVQAILAARRGPR